MVDLFNQLLGENVRQQSEYEKVLEELNNALYSTEINHFEKWSAMYDALGMLKKLKKENDELKLSLESTKAK